ncbi:Hydroxyethylthiazole kinase [Sodalis praecaptivus]
MQPSELPGAIAAQTLLQLRQQAPLVHCLTNDVVQTITANTLLALGASPLWWWSRKRPRNSAPSQMPY